MGDDGDCQTMELVEATQTEVEDAIEAAEADENDDDEIIIAGRS